MKKVDRLNNCKKLRLEMKIVVRTTTINPSLYTKHAWFLKFNIFVCSHKFRIFLPFQKKFDCFFSPKYKTIWYLQNEQPIFGCSFCHSDKYHEGNFSMEKNYICLWMRNCNEYLCFNVFSTYVVSRYCWKHTEQLKSWSVLNRPFPATPVTLHC